MCWEAEPPGHSLSTREDQHTLLCLPKLGSPGYISMWQAGQGPYTAYFSGPWGLIGPSCPDMAGLKARPHEPIPAAYVYMRGAKLKGTFDS